MPSLITGLTDQPNQQNPITLPDGSAVTLALQFRTQQLGWYYNLTWDGRNPNFAINGNFLVTSPNILRLWKNVLPFGIAVVTTDGKDPNGQEDFVDGTCSLYLLGASDIAGVESQFFPGS